MKHELDWSQPGEQTATRRGAALSRVRTQLERRLRAKWKLVDVPVRLPWSNVSYGITQPATIDPLLDAAVDDPEEHVPYWAVIWPSGIALADLILAHRDEFAGKCILELGCGLGITATAAIATGAQLCVTDYGPEALLLCRLNAMRNTGRQPDTLQLNWRQPRAALFTLATPPYSTLLASDVLYESRDVEPLLALVERLVAPDGTLWLAEPGRDVARRFVAAATVQGWLDDPQQHSGPWTDREDTGITVTIHRLRRASAVSG